MTKKIKSIANSRTGHISKVILIIIAILVYSAYASTLYYSNPDGIINEIKLRGSVVIVAELYQNHTIWKTVLQKIASGNESWLKVANALKGGSDAGSSEMLSLAVGEALEHNPVNVFKITLSHFELQNICSGPDVDDIRYDSYDLSMKAVNNRIAKIDAIKNHDLKEQIKECTRYLGESKEGLAHFYGIKNK